MAAGGEIGPRQSADRLATCRLAGEWLQTGQYEQAAAVLHTAQTQSAQTGDLFWTCLLDAAHRLCIACKQCQSETQWHRRVYQEAERREQELRQELYANLELIGKGETPTPTAVLEPEALTSLVQSETTLPESMLAELDERSSLWERIQALFGRRPPLPLSRPGPIKTLYGKPVQPPQKGAVLPQAFCSNSGLAPEAVSPDKRQEEQAIPSLVVYCLGPFRVYQDDQLITDWDSLKGKSILKYLLANHGKSVSKDVLMDLFWPDADPEAARRNLHQAIYNLRQTLRRGHTDFMHVQFEDDCYSLNPSLCLWVDSQEFNRHVQAGQRLQAAQRIAEAMAQYGVAESLYQGDFLEEDLYEDWPTAQREHMQRTYCDLADRLSEHYMQNGEYSAAIALCQRVLLRDNCHEQAYRRLMRCYLAQGHRHLAVRQYQTCLDVLRSELDLVPSRETIMLYQSIAAIM